MILDNENQPEFYIMNPLTQTYERFLPPAARNLDGQDVKNGKLGILFVLIGLIVLLWMGGLYFWKPNSFIWQSSLNHKFVGKGYSFDASNFR